MNANGRWWLLMAVLWLAAAPAARAQFSTVRGRVLGASDGRPIPGANVRLDDEAGTRFGTATGADGTFAIAPVPPGRYVLTASFVGYASHTDTLTLGFAEEVVREIRLAPEAEVLNEVVVSSETAGASTPRAAGFEQVRPTQLARVPMPDVSADLMAYLVTLPGVVTAGDRGGQLFVRGGTPTQNLVLVDGMRIFQPFHIIGFYSIFPADVLAYADVYAGGFGARYGGRVSSVIDVAMRNGSKERVRGAASMAPFLSAVRLEAPLVPGKMSVLASVRESVVERIAPVLLGQELRYRFGDVFLKTHAYLSKTSSFSATALNTYDRGNVADTEGGAQASRWMNQALGLRYTFVPPDMAVLAQFALYTSRFDGRYAPTADQQRRSAVSSFATDVLFAYLLGAHQVHFGLFASTMQFRHNLTGVPEDMREGVMEGGGFVDARLQLSDRFGIEPGLRVQAFSHGTRTAVEPRLRLSWRPGGREGRQQFSAAWGLYHQQVVGLYNPRDVTDAFVIWAPTPPNRPVTRTMHVIAGWQRKLGPSLDMTVEGFYKSLENHFFPRFGTQLGDVGRIEQVSGAVRGLDVRLEASRAWLYGYAGYGFNLVRYERPVLPGGSAPIGEDAAVERFSPPHDRRHQVNLLLQAARGPYRLGVRWQYGSGLPFTQVRGYYDEIQVAGPDDRSFHTDPGTTNLSYGPPYAARLPAYHRLDLSVDRRFEGRRWTATLQASLVNVYDRRNIFTYDLMTHRRIDQLPILPSVGLKVELR